MSVSATLSGNGISVTPGEESTLVLTIRNAGATVDEFELVARGALARHVVPETPRVSLFPNDEATVGIAIRIPRTSSVVAGAYPVAVLVTSTVDRSRTAVPESSITVEPFSAVEATLRPQSSRGSSRARHVLDITNVGNVPSAMRITPTEPDELLALQPQVEAVRLDPGQRQSVPVVVRSMSPVLKGSERRPFQLLVQPTDAPSISVDGAMQVLPGLFRRFGKPLLAAAAVLAALALWLGTRRAEPQSQVRELPLAASTSTSSIPVTDATTSTTVPTDVPTTVANAPAPPIQPTGQPPTTTQPAPIPGQTPHPAQFPTATTTIPIVQSAPPVVATTTTSPPPPPPPPPPPVNTVFTTTAAAVSLDLGGGAFTTVAGLDVPPGVWAINAESSVINFDAADYVRCALFGDGAQIDASTVFVGGASTTPYAAVSNLAVFTAAGASRIELRCTHDSTLAAGTRLYIDPSASMVATRASGVVSASTAVSSVLTPPAQVTSVNLPPGTWLVQSKSSVVNFGALDYVRCSLLSGAASVDGTTTTVGGSPGSPAVATARNVAVVTVSSATTVSLHCSEDGSSTSAYADPGTQLVAVPVTAGLDMHTTSSTPTPLAPSLSTVNAMDLPAGEWTVVAKASAVSWDTGSAVRCRVVAAGAIYDQRVVLIGGSTNPVSVISNVAHFVGAAAVHVEAQCSDDQHPKSFLDAGAALIAFQI
jgi:hypothetical protein